MSGNVNFNRAAQDTTTVRKFDPKSTLIKAATAGATAGLGKSIFTMGKGSGTVNYNNDVRTIHTNYDENGKVVGQVWEEGGLIHYSGEVSYQDVTDIVFDVAVPDFDETPKKTEE